MLFSPSVQETRDNVVVKWVARNRIQRDIQVVFQTSRVNTHLFKQIGSNSMVFDRFFALEFYYVLDRILSSEQNLYSSKRQLRLIQSLLKENTWMRSIDQVYPSQMNYEALKQFHFKLLPHQREFLDHYDHTVRRYNLKGLMLSAGAGTGKTFTSLALAECLGAEKIVVISPKPAVGRVWVKSLTSAPKDGGLYLRPQAVWTKESGHAYANERVAVAHYEGLEAALTLVPQLKSKNTVVILDEHHNLNEIVSLRTQRFIELCQLLEAKHIVLMSGTPVKAYSVELIPVLRAIDPLFTPKVEEKFKKLYKGGVQSTTEILTRRYNTIAYKVSRDVIKLAEPIHTTIELEVPNGDRFTLNAIGQDMQSYSIQRVKELEKQLPQATKFYYEVLDAHQTKHVKSKEDMKDYMRYEEAIGTIIRTYKSGVLYQIADTMAYATQYEKTKIMPNLSKEHREKFKEAKTLVKYLKLKVRGECLGRVLGRARIDAFKALAEKIAYDDIIDSTVKKSVIFTTYSEVIETALDRLKDLKYLPIAVYGPYTKDLTRIIERFEKERDLNPLVATYASLSTAVPLVMADTMIVINPPFRQYIMDQTIARIHRIGTTTQTRIFNIQLKTGDEINISSRTLNILEWSRNQVNAILGVEVEETEQEIALEHFREGPITYDALPPADTRPSYYTW